MTDSQPLLRIAARVAPRWAALAFFAGVNALVLLLVCAFNLVRELSWGRHLSQEDGRVLGFLLVFTVGAAWLARRLDRFAWTIEVREHGIEVWGETPPRFLHLGVAWREVRSFDDGASDFMTLETTTGRLDVPTRTEDVRVALLALLDAKGVGRRE